MNVLPGAPRERRTVAALAVGAVVLRLALFLGRGDYVAFDEGWYLILGRNLMAGAGYTLNGDPHVTLSPLFPILAGSVGAVIGDLVWGGRIVAAVTAGLIVLPCWVIFRTLAGRRTAMLGCVLVAVLPSLAPFVAPFYIGWDLWVGAEPVLHLLFYGGVALVVRAWVLDWPGARAGRRAGVAWLAAGAVFGLAYLARPEAIIGFGLLGLAVAGRALLRTRRLWAPVLMAAGFVLAAAPYWLYLHDATGRWQLTGRSVDIASATAVGGSGEGPAATIERMLWDDDEAGYLESLYGLDESGTRLVSPYWGVQPAASAETGRPGPVAATPPARAESVGQPPGSGAAPQIAVDPSEDDGRRVVRRYLAALGVVFPAFLVPFALLGLLAARRRFREETLVLAPVFGTSLLVAGLVASDPRTQLLVAPLAAFYAARGARMVGVLFDRRTGGRWVSRRFVGGLLAVVLVALPLETDARRLYLSLVAGSPQHLLGSGKRIVGEVLDERLAPGDPVMSWHPAIAVYAKRPWCVLPYADGQAIVRYARTRGCPTMVVSAFHPSPWPIAELGFEYVIADVPAEREDVDPTGAGIGEGAASNAAGPTLRLLEDHGRYARGAFQPR